MADPAGPSRLTIFSYQVGFGDCFLLRFDYDGAAARHILIDFGTTGLPEAVEKDHLVKIATDIKETCGGHLEAIVATHRHADHISGFATKDDGSGPGDIIASMSVNCVLQPWTEAPDASIDGLSLGVADNATAMRTQLRSLQAMHAVSSQLVSMLDSESLRRVPLAIRQQLDFVGRDNLKNASAVENLINIGEKGSAVYAYHGSNAGLDALLPGVTTHVLGPPTLAQTQTIRKQRARHPDEFWNMALLGMQQDAELGEETGRLFPNHPIARRSRLPRETRWIAERIDEARGTQLLSLVRALDSQMNNTSLILLFEAGGKSFLFPGDAQWENWEYALNSDYAVKLAKVDLYKLGHHGSTNATPKSLWKKFAKRDKDPKPGRLTTLLSTMPGKHGDTLATAVPNAKLFQEAASQSDMHSTHLFAPGQIRQQVVIDLTMATRRRTRTARGVARG